MRAHLSFRGQIPVNPISTAGWICSCVRLYFPFFDPACHHPDEGGHNVCCFHAVRAKIGQDISGHPACLHRYCFLLQWPFSSLFQEKTEAVDDFVYQATRNEGNVHLSDFEAGKVDVDSSSSSTHKGVFPTFYDEPWTPPGIPDLDEARLSNVEPYLKAIMDPRDRKFPRLRCPRPIEERYEILRRRRNFATRWDTPPRQWFFALNLYQCSHVLPRLLASVVQAMRFLRPEDCVLSIVGGRSNDGTTEVLAKLREEIEAMNVTYYFSTSDVDPLKSGNDGSRNWPNCENWCWIR